PIGEFPIVRDGLAPSGTDLAPRLRRIFRDAGQPIGARLRAGLALAAFSPEAAGWTDLDLEFLAETYLRAHPDDHRTLRSCLRPVSDRLVRPLRKRLRDPAQGDAVRQAAALALADFAAGRPQLL